MINDTNWIIITIKETVLANKKALRSISGNFLIKEISAYVRKIESHRKAFQPIPKMVYDLSLAI